MVEFGSPIEFDWAIEPDCHQIFVVLALANWDRLLVRSREQWSWREIAERWQIPWNPKIEGKAEPTQKQTHVEILIPCSQPYR